jgi:hypothetical protein
MQNQRISKQIATPTMGGIIKMEDHVKDGETKLKKT